MLHGQRVAAAVVEQPNKTSADNFESVSNKQKISRQVGFPLFLWIRYDWNNHPMGPPKTRAVVYEAPEGRTSWGTRGVDGWYCGPAFDHHRNMRFYIPETETKAYQTSASYDLFPSHYIPIADAYQINNTIKK